MSKNENQVICTKQTSSSYIIYGKGAGVWFGNTIRKAFCVYPMLKLLLNLEMTRLAEVIKYHDAILQSVRLC